MKFLKLLVIALLLSPVACSSKQEEKRAIIGAWLMQSASFPVEAQCRKMSFRFDVDGTYIGNDGSMEMKATYKVVSESPALVLQFSSVSDNDHPNCQGRSPSYVRSHPPGFLLVQATADPAKKRFFFGPTEESPSVLVVRAK